MAEIFLARPADVALSKLVALKRILPDYSDRANFREMFLREGEIALRFRHPSIVVVNEIGQVGSEYYMSMEYFPGKTLGQLANKLRSGKGALDLAEKIHIIKCVAEALQYIHDFTDYGDLTEIIHRDISPQNILIGFDGATKLIDFGVAKVNTIENATDTKNIKGKFAYMSPEQIRGEKLTKQTDIFSLGIVFWELLNGRKLFASGSIDEVMRNVASFQTPKLVDFGTDLPYVLCRICQRCLARSPEERFQSAGELARELDGYLRKSAEGGHQHRIAQAMHAIFSEDVSKLRAQLRKYEQRDDEVESSESGASTAVARERENPKPRRSATPPPPMASTRKEKGGRSGHSKTRSSAEPPSWVTPTFWGLAIVGVLVALVPIVNGLRARLSESGAVSDSAKHATETKQETISVAREEPQAAIQVPPPPASFQVHPPPPPASTPSLPPVAEVPAPQPPPLHRTVVSARKAESVPRKKQMVVVSRRRPPVQEKKKAERKVAAVPRGPAGPVRKPTALLTILADPEAQILIDEKNVGTELVNNFKVSADKKIVIKVISKDGQSVRTQTVSLKPFSSNVIDMAGQGGEP